MIVTLYKHGDVMAFNIQIDRFNKSLDFLGSIYSEDIYDKNFSKYIPSEIIKIAKERLSCNAAKFGCAHYVGLQKNSLNFNSNTSIWFGDKNEANTFIWFGDKNEIRGKLISKGVEFYEFDAIQITPGVRVLDEDYFLKNMDLYSPKQFENIINKLIELKEINKIFLRDNQEDFSNQQSYFLSVGSSIWEYKFRYPRYDKEYLSLFTPFGPIVADKIGNVVSIKGVLGRNWNSIYKHKSNSLSAMLEMTGLENLAMSNSRGDIFFDQNSIERMSAKIIGYMSFDM